MLLGKYVLKICSKFTRKHQCRSVTSIKLLICSPPEVVLGKGVLKICSSFTGERLWGNVILLKLLCNTYEGLLLELVWLILWVMQNRDTIKLSVETQRQLSNFLTKIISLKAFMLVQTQTLAMKRTYHNSSCL